MRACLEEGRKGRGKAAFCLSVCLSQMYAALFAPRVWTVTKVHLALYPGYVLNSFVLRMSQSWAECWCLYGTSTSGNRRFYLFLGN